MVLGVGLDDSNAMGLSPSGQPYRVLIVDDSMFVKKQLTQILMSEKFDVIDTAADGIEAINKYKEKQNEIDLITMDITMPNKDGISAMKDIIAFDANAVIVMVSALGKEDLVKESLLAGAKGYIVKPLARNKVLERLGKVLA